MPSPSGSPLKQTSAGGKSTSRRWGCINRGSENNITGLRQMEGLGNGAMVMRKRVMVVVDDGTSHSKHAVMWALTHASDKGDILTLLHVVPLLVGAHPCSPCLVNSLVSLCKASKPEVEVEALVIQGPKLATIMSQVKKLEVAVCVLGQKKCPPLFNPLFNCICGGSSSEELVEDCINNLECLTVGVRKQSNGVGGYLISTKWQKDFWLLA